MRFLKIKTLVSSYFKFVRTKQRHVDDRDGIVLLAASAAQLFVKGVVLVLAWRNN